MKRRHFRIVEGKAQHSFSTGEVVEALQGAGVPTDEAIRLARETEKHYFAKAKKVVELQALVDFLAGALQKRFGSELAWRLASFSSDHPLYRLRSLSKGVVVSCFRERPSQHLWKSSVFRSRRRTRLLGRWHRGYGPRVSRMYRCKS